MGSYISCGFVFKNDKIHNRQLILKSIIDTLQLDEKSLIILKACKDLEGEHWIEQKTMVKDLKTDDLDVVTEHHYGHVLALCSFLGVSHKMVNITFYKGKYFFGYLLDLYQDEFNQKTSYVNLEERLHDYILKCHELFIFDYAFCDNEGEIEYSPYEIYDDEINYSLLILNDPKQGLIIKKGEYLLDGITKRHII